MSEIQRALTFQESQTQEQRLFSSEQPFHNLCANLLGALGNVRSLPSQKTGYGCVLREEKPEGNDGHLVPVLIID